VIDGSGAKFSVKLFGSEAAEVVDVVGPQVEDVVPAEAVSLFEDDDLGAEKLSFDGSSKAAGTGADDEHALTGAGLAAVVDLVRRTFVKLCPQGLCFPRLELRFDLRVEVGEFRRLKPEYFAKVTERSENGLEGVGLAAEVIENLVSQGEVDVDALGPHEALRDRTLVLFVGHFVPLISLFH